MAGGKIVQPRRDVPVLHKTSVLVVGGGPAGTAAAFSAKRLGVDVTLVERYGYLGGLATGGLVLGIFPLYDRANKQVIYGIGEDFMNKLDVLKYGIIDRNKAPVYPTFDAEAFKICWPAWCSIRGSRRISIAGALMRSWTAKEPRAAPFSRASRGGRQSLPTS